jgi:type 1 glutamine amidotransferase
VPEAIVYTGGVSHSFERSSPVLGALLAEAGLPTRITGELDDVVDLLAREPRTLLVVYALRWTMTQHEKYAVDRPRWGLSIGERARRAIVDHVRGGGGLFGLHTASICFDDWPEWHDVLGGSWQWGTSFHPPCGPVRATPSASHELTAGLGAFEVEDEVYSAQRVAPGVAVGAWAEAVRGEPATGVQPVLWTHRYGAGRVVYDALGHDERSLRHPTHAEIIRRAAAWASARESAALEA